MISATQIHRLAEASEFRQLIDRILSNGRCPSKLARSYLARSHSLDLAAFGLALQRVVELTYRPSEAAQELAGRLIPRLLGRASDHAVTNEGQSIDIAAIACAVRGLSMYRDQCLASGDNPQPVNHAIDRGIQQIAAEASTTDAVCKLIPWAIVLWQLGDDGAFRTMVDVDRLLALLHESAAAEIIEDALCQYAMAMAA